MRATAVKAKGAPATKAQKERVKGTLVTPDYTLKLMELQGPTWLAKEIGTTPGTLHKARNAGLISKPLEVAAKGVWDAHGFSDMTAEPAAPTQRTSNLSEAVLAPTSENIVTFLVAVPRDKAEIMHGAIKAMGGRIFVQQD